MDQSLTSAREMETESPFSVSVDLVVSCLIFHGAVVHCPSA